MCLSRGESDMFWSHRQKFPAMPTSNCAHNKAIVHATYDLHKVFYDLRVLEITCCLFVLEFGTGDRLLSYDELHNERIHL